MTITLDATNGMVLPGTATGTQVGSLTLGTVQEASGAALNFTDIPSWVKRITLTLSGLSTNGASNWLVQLGTASSYETTGYLSTGTFLGSSTGGTAYTTGFGLMIGSSSHAMHGSIVFSLLSSASNTWTGQGNMAGTGAGVGFLYSTAGAKSLASVLTRVRFTTVNGTDTFDAGSVNILYE